MDQPFHSFCIVADDLSGAADCAAVFAAVAGPVPVALDAASLDAPCLALDTDSRGLDEAVAMAVTAAAFERLAGRGRDHLVYKKIDSTLRGHVGAELAAALRVLPAFAGAIVAPAFPQQGRTLVDGRLLVQGRPAEPPGHGGDLVAMIEAAGLPVALVSRPLGGPSALLARLHDALAQGARALVVDAADQDDLDRLAAALCSPGAPQLLVAGSAGLARSLARHLQPRTVQPGSALPVAQEAGAVLALVGSFSAASAAQVRQLEASGAALVIRLSAAQWLEAQHATRRRVAVASASEALRSGHHVVLAVAGDVVQPFSRTLVLAMAAAAAPLLSSAGTCVLTGGDTARAMFNQLRIARLDVLGEVENGISIAAAPAHPAIRFILKAGGFGDPLALQRIIRQFGRPTTARPAAPT